MDFGNCHSVGTVVAYKNGVEIASIEASATDKIEFEFVDGDVIKMTEFSNGILQFNDLEIIKCTQGKYFVIYYYNVHTWVSTSISIEIFDAKNWKNLKNTKHKIS